MDPVLQRRERATRFAKSGKRVGYGFLLLAIVAFAVGAATGFAGASGIPAFTSQDDPVLGASVTLDLGSSASGASVAFVIFGYAETFVPTSKGGDLLVAPAFTLVLALPTAGTTIAGTLPDDESACGFELFAQALELDPGAPKGVSFTAGLKLVCGR